MENNRMGILIENAGILRTTPEDRSTAVFDSTEFITENGLTSDPHCAFSFIRFSDDTCSEPMLPYRRK